MVVFFSTNVYIAGETTDVEGCGVGEAPISWFVELVNIGFNVVKTMS